MRTAPLSLLTAATLLMAGCATAPPQAAAPPVERVAIVAALPTHLNLTTSGVAASQNVLDPVDIAGWHLDDVAAKAASETIHREHGTAITTVDASFREAGGSLSQAPDLGAQLRQRTHVDGPVSAYLVLRWALGSDPATNNAGGPAKIGVYKTRQLLSTADPVAYVHLVASVVDAQSGKVVTAQNYIGTAGAPVCTETLNGFQWKDRWADLSEEQHQVVKSTITRLVDSCTRATLASMKL